MNDHRTNLPIIPMFNYKFLVTVYFHANSFGGQIVESQIFGEKNMCKINTIEKKLTQSQFSQIC